jgi:hypothetical protein
MGHGAGSGKAHHYVIHGHSSATKDRGCCHRLCVCQSHAIRRRFVIEGRGFFHIVCTVVFGRPSGIHRAFYRLRQIHLKGVFFHAGSEFRGR